MNFFTYPLKIMRITQNYSDGTSHKLHWYNSKDYVDYPIDDGGKDGGRDGIYCPCDEMEVTEIKGVGNNNITNTIWLVSTSKVNTPTFYDYAFMSLTHSNDSDFKNIKVGTKFRRGDLIVKEGENINVATHIHMSFGKGSSNGWIYNSNNKLVTKGNTKKPEEVCYIDNEFTIIKNSGGINWVSKPIFLGTPVTRIEINEQIEVKIDNLRARKTPEGKILGYVNPGIYNIFEKNTTEEYIWYKIENFWIAYSQEWAVLYLKQEKVDDTDINNSLTDTPNDVVVNEKETETKSIWKKILNFFLKLFKK